MGKAEVPVQDHVPVPQCHMDWLGDRTCVSEMRGHGLPFPVVIPPTPQIRPFVNTAFVLRRSWRSLGISRRSFALSDSRGHWTEKYIVVGTRVWRDGQPWQPGCDLFNYSVSHSFTPRARSSGIEYKLCCFSFSYCTLKCVGFPRAVWMNGVFCFRHSS
jgi:hypothetical protein